jgi:hypothetical protein
LFTQCWRNGADFAQIEMPVSDKIPIAEPAERTVERPAAPSPNPPAANLSRTDDGTHALLQAGSWIMLAAILALIATDTLFGGIGIDGPHTNTGWLSFMFALMGVPFGLMLLILGVAKWLRNRRAHRQLSMRP